LKKKILIIGSYGSSNIGDEAILESILKNLPENSEKFVLSGNPKFTEETYKVKSAIHLPFGFRSFFSFKWIKSFIFLKKTDLVVLGGGGLFTDEYTLKAVFLWTWHVFWAKVFRKRIIQFSVSVGEMKTWLGEKLTTWSLKQCEKIIVRDQISEKIVKKLSPMSEVILGTDVVFQWNEDLSKIKRSNFIAISLRDWEIDLSAINDFINSCLSKNYRVLLIPMEDNDEVILREYVKHHHVFMAIPENFSELLQILKTCEKAIGMRLHFLIAAAIAGCKVGGISYSSKVKGILDELELLHISPKEISLGNLENLFKKVSIAKNLEAQKKKAVEMFKELL